jgi:hypothetical protein
MPPPNIEIHRSEARKLVNESFRILGGLLAGE